MNLIFIGPPGSGKGTQGNLLKQFGYTVLSTGDLLRAEVAKKTELGQKIDNIISKGNLVSDELAVELIQNNLSKDNNIIDGIPRTLNQAKILESIVKDFKIIFFKLDLSVLESRLVKRFTCSSCKEIVSLDEKLNCPKCGLDTLVKRKDDTSEVIRNRFKVYQDAIDPILDYYKNKLITINADQSVEKVNKDLLKVLKFSK